MSKSKKAKRKSYKKRKGVPPKKRHGPLYKVPFRRRRELKTDYSQRKRLLRSGRTRIVIRPSSKHVIVQFVKSKIGGDQTLVQTRSYELEQYDWDISTSNLPAAYLTGYLAGKKALKADIDDAILDLGIFEAIPGTRIFASLKGVIDAGVNVPCNKSGKKSMFPEESRIRGEHIAEYGKVLSSEDKEKYESLFSGYLSVKKKPEDAPKYFEKTKEKINEL